MVNVSKFVREYTPLCVCTLGLAILGYLGYHTVRWVINKCHRTEKIDEVAQKKISRMYDQPSAYPSKSLVKKVKHDIPKTNEIDEANKINLPEKHFSEKEGIELKTKLMAKDLLNEYSIMFSLKGKKLTEKEWLSNYELYAYASVIAIEYPELYPWTHSSSWRASKLSDANLQNIFLKSNCRYLFTFVCVAENHWTLLLIDKEIKRVEYYDSKCNYGGGDYIKTINEAKQVAKNFGYKFEEKIAKSIQSDSYQCGIWVLYFLEERIKEPNISFNAFSNPSKLIANFRKRISDRFLIIDQVLTIKLAALKEVAK